MPANSSLVPTAWRLHTARQFIESIQEEANSTYYMFFGESPPRDGLPPAIPDDVLSTTVNPFRNMIAGKRITSNTVSLVIRNIPYESKEFAMYDDDDDDLFSKDFYAITNAGSFYHVWKCLDNNMGANSTVEPNFSDIDEIDEVYETSDGYRWKYMYSVTDVEAERFSTVNYFPVSSNTTVESHAVPGAIDIIKVEDVGEGYHNYLLGTFSSGDIKVNGNATLYAVTGNSVASGVNGFYTGTLLYISAGTGAGQYRRIVSYFVNGNGKFVVINSAFTTAPKNSSQYQIYPEVEIIGDGAEGSNAIARALVNASASNSIYRVEMLDRGSGYSYARTRVVANDAVSVVANAEVRAIFSPPGGHGSDAAAELGCHAVTVAVTFANTEGNTIPANTKFQQVGIVRDPLFANVELILNSPAVAFSAGETVRRIDSRLIATGVSIEAANVTISLGNARFDERLKVGDEVLLENSTNDVHQIVSVNAVAANTFTSNVDPDFTDSNSTIFLINSHAAHMSVLSVDAIGQIHVANTPGTVEPGDVIVGESSGAYAVIDAVKRAGANATFSTFVAAYAYSGSWNVGVFANNEIVYQGDDLEGSSANGVVVAVETKGGLNWVYVANQVGIFLTDQVMKGANSGSTFNIATKYSPDIEFGSGAIVYLENIDTVQRSANVSEQISITMVF